MFQLAWAAVMFAIVCGPRPSSEPEVFPVDPVSLVRGTEAAGRAEFSVVRGNYRYQFADAANKAAFEKDRPQYEIQCGGACARMGPFSGIGSVDLYAVHDGHIYLFASSACRTSFLKSPEAMIERDDPAPQTTPETIARGKSLLDRALLAMGGPDRIDSLDTYCERRLRTQESQGRFYRVGQVIAFQSPDSYARRDSWDDSWWSSVTAGDDAWSSTNDHETRAYDAAQRKALRKEWNRHPLGILRARTRPDFVVVAAGSEEREGETIELATFHFEDASTTLGIGRDGRIVLARCVARGESLRFCRVERFYAEFKEVDGLTLPHSVLVTCDGVPWAAESGPIDAIEVNKPLEQGLLERAVE